MSDEMGRRVVTSDCWIGLADVSGRILPVPWVRGPLPVEIGGFSGQHMPTHAYVLWPDGSGAYFDLNMPPTIVGEGRGVHVPALGVTDG